MTQILRRATRASIALLIAAFLPGCYTAAPPSPSAYTTGTPHGYASYASPSGSFGIGVFTSAPRTHGDAGFIWYYGNHPHPVDHSLGSFCALQDSHRHDYVPHHSHRYAYNDGHYFWVGDAKPYKLTGESYAYHGHHPHPHYFGGNCRIHGLHQHGYSPASADYYRLKSGAYFFTGIYGSDYYAERDRYDARGWKLEHGASGYREHERALEGERTVGAAERMDARRVTPQELVDRMRERTHGASASPPASHAADETRE